jgi:predicted O-linked N-acetylglucosamine transferase (SPINDLY family)
MSRNALLRRRQNAVTERPEVKAAELCLQAKRALAQGNLNAAQDAYVAVLELGVEDADTLNNLAAIYDKKHVKTEEILDLLKRAFELAPEGEAIRRNYLGALTKRLNVLERAGRYREALPLLLQRVEIEPDLAHAQRALGYCYSRIGQNEIAIKHYTRAINLEPNNPAYYNDLGLACFELRLLAEAQGAFQQVLNLEPKSLVAFIHLGLLANLMGVMGVAVNMMRRALEVDPNSVEAHNNLALFLRERGEAEESRHHYLEALRLNPQRTAIFSGYLLSLNDDSSADPAWVASEHRRFNALVAGQNRRTAPRSSDPARKLRIGYLSPDFRAHSVAYFMAPLLEAHDRNVVEVTCYASGYMEDGVTARIRKGADRWRKVFRMSNDDLAVLIQEDEIDVLVELSGHTGDNRLVMLAERVAPVQVTYLGYPNTTGLANMDYRITDSIADPEGVSDGWHTEKLLRMDGGFLAYSPPVAAEDAPVAALPAWKNKHITFGSFNNLAKLNDGVLEIWTTILSKIPDSRLLLKARGLRDEGVKKRILDALVVHGKVDEARIRLLAHEREKINHLKIYDQVDLALDTFPYNGTTTTCEAMWMGVPVLTLEGSCHAGRVGTSLLSRVGLSDFVAKDGADYIEKAVAWAGRIGELAELRSGLRGRLMASPLMDAGRLARELEAAYRQAWQGYLQNQAATPGP